MGEDSKLARSFDRLKSIVRRRKLLRQAVTRTGSRRGSASNIPTTTTLPPPEYREKSDNEQNTRLEAIVREAISSHHLNLLAQAPSGNSPSATPRTPRTPSQTRRQMSDDERQYQITRQHESGSRGQSLNYLLNMCCKYTGRL